MVSLARHEFTQKKIIYIYVSLKGKVAWINFKKSLYQKILFECERKSPWLKVAQEQQYNMVTVIVWAPKGLFQVSHSYFMARHYGETSVILWDTHPSRLFYFIHSRHTETKTSIGACQWC